MTLRRSSLFVSLGAALVFSFLYQTEFFGAVENRIYDFFLRFRPARQRIENVVFLDVDDQAISHIGVFPWPRSVVADGLLRLKEFGAAAAIFDIEYIEQSPAGIDTIYLERSLPLEFNRGFAEISSGVEDLFSAVSSGRMSPSSASGIVGDINALIDFERKNLLEKAGGIALDNDEYLAQASALFGQTWATLNLQRLPLEEEEQAERRPYAEEHFSYPVRAEDGAPRNEAADVLPPLPSFMKAARGAGFTNVLIDGDGVRRRIPLVREAQGRWYLQLAFAPLVEFLGNPEIHLEKRKLTLKNTRLPGKTEIRDIVIPLDQGGSMFLDWPTTGYAESYTHLSFEALSRLEEHEFNIEQYIEALLSSELWFWPEPEQIAGSGGLSLFSAQRALAEARDLLSASLNAKRRALAETSSEEFDEYISLRNEAFSLVKTVLDAKTGERIAAAAENLAWQYPDQAGLIGEEAEYVSTALEYLETTAALIDNIRQQLRDTLEGKACIIGRVDTGTTDIGVNPFYPEYVNVGTHGVALDTILSETFIIHLDTIWSAALCFILTPLLIVFLSGLSPQLRTLLGFGGAAIIFGGSFFFFRLKGIFFGPLGPALAVVTAVIIREVIAYMGSEQEKQFIRSAFSRYLSPEVINQLIADPSLLKLGGDSRDMTAVFTDIRSFSTISEALGDPVKLVELLNYYLTRMSDIILENGGTIDKYEGDAIIAFFGAPIYTPEHAILACRSAVKMNKAEPDINREALAQGLITAQVMEALFKKGILPDPGDPNPLFTRIGLNTGEMVVGNMGTSNKMNYTIMGNAVNLAARLEGVNKQYDTAGILISEYTRDKVGSEFLLRSLDRVRVVGINTPLRLYEVMDIASEAPPDLKTRIALFHEGLDLFEQRDWTTSRTIFEDVLRLYPQDGPTKKYLNRCLQFQKEAPAADWDGVFSLTEK
jgi:adenylate cyclase